MAAKDQRRGVAKVASVVVGVAMLAGAVAAFPSVRIAYYRRVVEGRDDAARKPAAEKLASLGDRGIHELESIAFSDEVAKRDDPRTPARQTALDALWKTEPYQSPDDIDVVEIPIDRLALHMGAARGLRRPWVS